MSIYPLRTKYRGVKEMFCGGRESGIIEMFYVIKIQMSFICADELHWTRVRPRIGHRDSRAKAHLYKGRRTPSRCPIFIWGIV